ncbi:MAG TPA: ornithine carbamoyltransferase [Jatrophihabitans sp.]|nr:ornithine carbamoyltransferase [Jatrophihabitans sp.]
MTSAATGSLLKELDLEKKQFLGLVELATYLKQERASGAERQRLAGRTIALLFEKNSTRIRCAFEVAAAEQGARTTFIGPEGSHLGREESVRDTARVLGRLYDGIAFRGSSQASVEQLAAHAHVPVWNALTDLWHPTQMLADVLTMSEHHDGSVEDVAFCYTGDGRNNVARSLLVTGALLGMDVRIAAPPYLQPPDGVVAVANYLGAESGARVTVTADVRAGVRGVDFVYTDVWLSMGESEGDWARRVEELLPYRVTSSLMVATGKPSKFMHCLPATHNRETALGRRLFNRFGLDGVEVTEQVFESEASIAFDQAENRMHTIKAVLVAALTG